MMLGASIDPCLCSNVTRLHKWLLLCWIYITRVPVTVDFDFMHCQFKVLVFINLQWIYFQVPISQMSRFVSPLNPAVYPTLGMLLTSIGVFFMAWFFVYEITGTKYVRELFKEVLIATIASIFMGTGLLFVALWVGIYVWRYWQTLSQTRTELWGPAFFTVVLFLLGKKLG